MLAKKHRLTERRDFLRVQETGKTFQSANFGIAMFDRNDSNPPRFGFIISTKISKDAVDRNTIRRHMSETVRSVATYVKDGHDIVFLAKTSIIRLPAESLVREIRTAIKEAGLMKE